MTKRSDSFLTAYEDCVWDVYGYFGYRVRGREEAEDLTQATFERAFKAWGRFDADRASVRTWLLTIAHNLLVDHYRREGDVRHDPIDHDDDLEPRLGTAPDPGDLGLSPELESGLELLSSRERELIALRFGGDLRGPEIAELTGLSLANVQQILSRALRKLKESLRGRDEAATRRPD